MCVRARAWVKEYWKYHNKVSVKLFLNVDLLVIILEAFEILEPIFWNNV